MITRLEIDGFKTFRDFSIDFRPFSAVVGPNASGKSNLFDAIKLVSLISQQDLRSAMQQLRGEPEELFRRQHGRVTDRMTFAIEVILPKAGVDAFGTRYDVSSRRLRYKVAIEMKRDNAGLPTGLSVVDEECSVIPGTGSQLDFLAKGEIPRSNRQALLIDTEKSSNDTVSAFKIRQDGIATNGAPRRGVPRQIPADQASRTALSTIQTSEFRHLYALKDILARVRFLEINPQMARRPNDRLEEKALRSDASNLSAVLAEIQRQTSAEGGSQGEIPQISADLTYLIPSVRQVIIRNDESAKEYSFDVVVGGGVPFSSRVISDGTLRLLALLAIIDDPKRTGVLCFEEPENGVHEGRIPALVELLRSASSERAEDGSIFQIIINTHSPALMKALEDTEIIAADSIIQVGIGSEGGERRTRMRRFSKESHEIPRELVLTRPEVERILKVNSEDV